MNTAFDACHSLKGTVMKDVCCLGRPGRDRALSRGDIETAFIGMVKMFLYPEEEKSALVGGIVE